MMVRHNVENFPNWKTVYDEHVYARKQSGLKDLYLLKNVTNQNDVTLLFEIEDLAKAKTFAESENLHEAMKESGVIGAPEIFFYKA